MKNCRKCRKANCEYRDVVFKNQTIICSEGCPLEIHRECQEIATPEFRAAIEQLREKSHVRGVINILKTADCIIYAADDIRN